MHKDVPWIWSQVQDTAFMEMKQIVTKVPVLAYNNPKVALMVQCDASSEGLGLALLQQGKPVIYMSRTLTDTEERYAQIKKEMLVIVFSLEKISLIHLWQTDRDIYRPQTTGIHSEKTS